MSDPCPHCDAPLKRDSFCTECGYDVDLAVADYTGEGTELPDDEFDYEATLRREGLGGGGAIGGGKPWPLLVAVALMLAAMIALIVLRG